MSFYSYSPYLWDLHAVPASECEHERACAVMIWCVVMTWCAVVTWSCHRQQPKTNSSLHHLHHRSSYCLCEWSIVWCSVQCTMHKVQCVRHWHAKIGLFGFHVWQQQAGHRHWLLTVIGTLRYQPLATVSDVEMPFMSVRCICRCSLHVGACWWLLFV